MSNIPQAIGMAVAFDVELLKKAGDVVSVKGIAGRSGDRGRDYGSRREGIYDQVSAGTPAGSKQQRTACSAITAHKKVADVVPVRYTIYMLMQK